MQQQTTLQTTDRIPAGIHGFEVLGTNGDTKYIWDKNNAAEVEAARALFKTLVKDQGFAAFLATGEKGVAGEQVREFKPEYERLLFTPALAGG